MAPQADGDRRLVFIWPGEGGPPVADKESGVVGKPVPRRPKSTPPRKFSTGFATLRDLISFVAGMAIIYHEVFQSKQVDAAAVGVGVALLGLPVVFGADE